MIYLDSAATSLWHPKEAEERMMQALRGCGNAGRGAHDATLDAGRVVFETRMRLAELFHAESPERIAFTCNDTEALNTAIFGLLEAGDHVITTVCEHNSVLRPLYAMEKQGLELTIVPADASGRIDDKQMEAAVRENTKAIVVTHASNLTGNITDLARVHAIAERDSLLLIVDAAQTAGILPIDVQKSGIDVLCFSGHKGLLGPQGTGGIYVRPGLFVRPLKMGGSGIRSYEKEQPKAMPEHLEAGTLNVHGIAGLCGALEYLEKTGIDTVYQREMERMRFFLEEIRGIPGLVLYGTDDLQQRVPTAALNIGSCDSGRVSDWLYEEYGIAVRSGAHCAPLMHEALGTREQGAVRFSFSHVLQEDEVRTAAQALRQFAEEEMQI
ncbi:aminotransferase class V-fold PLP-dependent enzyme [Fusicatenibacter sp.]